MHARALEAHGAKPWGGGRRGLGGFASAAAPAAIAQPGAANDAVQLAAATAEAAAHPLAGVDHGAAASDCRIHRRAAGAEIGGAAAGAADGVPLPQAHDQRHAMATCNTLVEF